MDARMKQGGIQKRSKMHMARSLSCALLALSAALPVTQAIALGLGGVKTQSYIGQPLRVEIPLYNVEAPDSLEIDFERLDGSSAEGLSAVLSRADSQLSIVIQSEGVVNEPYFNFALNLDDQGNAFRKQFTVLLDLSPSAEREVITGSVQERSQPYNDGGAQLSVQSVENSTAPGSVMGPYDWAEAGSIPEKFGAVLDGQSLWRVARRISPAMNVTNNQMMWALYKANPEAFSTDKIESLQAGTYLSIPQAAQVASVSDSEAKRFLDSLSRGTVAPVAANAEGEQQAVSSDQTLLDEFEDPLAAVDDLGDEALDAASSDAEVAQAGNQNFQLTGLGTSVNEDGELVSVDGQSGEIIASLSDTIASMTEQLGRKDKQIEVLEGQVAELQEYIESDSALSLDAVGGGSQESAQVVEDTSAVQSDVAKLESVTAQSDDSESTASKLAKSPYVWLLGLLGLLVLAALLFRERLASLWRSLNIGGEKEPIEFAPASYDVSEINQPSVAVLEPQERSAVSTSSVNEAPSLDELTSELDFDEPYSEPQVFEVEEDLDFDERFAKLLEEGEFEFARQLLDIAHGREVEHEKYHFYRLQLLAKSNDEDAFYDYYYSIENDISGFESTVQTDISKLVVQLAQH